MPRAYSNPKRASDPHALPDVEVFFLSARQAVGLAMHTGDDPESAEAGWYWWACFPGCLPDGEPSGPYATEAEALADAQSGADDSDEDSN